MPVARAASPAHVELGYATEKGGGWTVIERLPLSEIVDRAGRVGLEQQDVAGDEAPA
ncbi:MAG: hypothetical protein ACK5ZG_15340 [Phycisphaerae bacterium]